MRVKTGTLGFFAAVAFLLLICANAYATDTSAAVNSGEKIEPAYYTLIDPERYTLIHEMRLVNTSVDTVYDINVRVALMDRATPLYTNRLREQLIPWPDRIETDEYGRRAAYYHFEKLNAGQELLFTQKYVLECGGINYPGLSTASQAGYEEQLAAQYLLPSRLIESDNMEIIAFAEQVAGREHDAYAMAKAAFAEVYMFMTYAEEDLNIKSPDRGALRALHRARGVCEDYSKLYVAVLRALGIAARQQSGYLYIPRAHDKPPYVDEEGRLNLNSLRHAWAEFYLPGKGWVIADPTFIYGVELDGVYIKYINWDFFAGITEGRRYIFFREESLNEEDAFKFSVGSRNGTSVQSFFKGYLLPGTRAAYFNDVEGHWAEEYIMRLSDRDEPLLQGMGNGMFGVRDPMTRAQLVTCLQRLMKSPPAGPIFNDLSPSHWAYRDIGSAQQAGWISGYPDGSFRPNRPVTRAELAQLLVTVFELKAPGSEPSLDKDATEITQEVVPAAESTNKAASTGEPAEAAEKADNAAGYSKAAEVASAAGSAKAADEADPTGVSVEIVDENTPPLSTAPPVFLDLGRPGYAWADGAITILFLLGFSQGDGQGYYQPERPVTRAEFAAFLDRIITAQEQALEQALEQGLTKQALEQVLD